MNWEFWQRASWVAASIGWPSYFIWKDIGDPYLACAISAGFYATVAWLCWLFNFEKECG